MYFMQCGQESHRLAHAFALVLLALHAEQLGAVAFGSAVPRFGVCEVSKKNLYRIVCSFCSQDSHRMLLECFETKTVALLRNQILRFHQSGWQAECDSLVGSEIQCLGQEPNTCGQYTNRSGSKTSVCHYCKRLIRNSLDLLRRSQPKRKWTF